MAKVHIASAGAPLSTGLLQLQNGDAMDATLRVVADQDNTLSPLSLSTGLVSVSSTLQIATNDLQYIDAEDTGGNNRFTVSRSSGSQVVNVDFASNPTLGTEQVGAIRTYQDGVSLSDSISFLKNGNVGIGTSTPSARLHVQKVQSTDGIYLQTGTTGVFLQSDNGGGSSLWVKQSGIGIGTAGGLTATAQLHIKGSGSTSATTSLLVQNSSGNSSLTIFDDKSSQFGGSVTSISGGFITTGGSSSNDSFYTSLSGQIKYYVSLGGYLKSTSQLISNTNGAGTIDASAILQADSTTRGFLPPRMTTAQKTVIASPAAGLVVYDTTLNKLCVYTTAWETITSV